MNLFNRLPGFVPSPPGLEHRIWQRLPAVLLWGTLLPLALAAFNHLLAWGTPPSASDEDGDALTLAYQWRRNGAVLGGGRFHQHGLQTLGNVLILRHFLGSRLIVLLVYACFKLHGPLNFLLAHAPR